MSANGEKSKLIKKDDTGNYILEHIFKDVHEYEAYFEISNNSSIHKAHPNELRISFDLNSKKHRLLLPDNERVVEVIIPITKKQNNDSVKDKLTKRYIDEYGGLIPKIRFSLQSQVAASYKVLRLDPRVKSALNNMAKENRNNALKRVKAKGGK